MANNTYVALKTTTVGTATSSVTLDLSSITGYTDIEIIATIQQTTDANNFYFRFNGDTGTHYSSTRMMGSGSTAYGGRTTGESGLHIAWYGEPASSGSFGTYKITLKNYASTAIYKTALTRYGNLSNPDAGTGFNVGLWRGSTGSSYDAITSVTFYPSSGNILAGSTFTAYGIANADVGAYATGGIITQDANYYYHAFGSSSTFTPTRNLTADILVVAGGGGGGYDGGGGGAGGLIYSASQSLTSGTGYSCTVGSFGAGKTTSGGTGGAGSNSQFASLTAAIGGGGGGSQNSDGAAGGSGGGAGRSGSAHAGGTASQGYAGGVNTTSPQYNGGGGGGFGTIGAAGTASKGGNGGDGVNTYSSWLSATGLGVNGYIAAGGGAGGSDGSGSTASGTGGLGGGGNGGFAAVGSNAVASTGSGGGGGGFINSSSTLLAGGNGGSGLIIVRYAK